MKRKILASVLSLTLVTTSSSVVFAADEIDGQQIIAEHQAAIVEEVVGTEDVCTDIEESKKDFTVEGESLELEIPKDGDDEIIMASEDGEEIAMGLPEEAERSEAVLTDDGTVVYNTKEDVSVAVQAMQETQGNLVLEGVRSMVIIENADAPKEYSFNYDLPKGYELVKSEEYYADEEDAESGWIYIVDTENVLVDQETGEEFTDIVTVIEPAWATDANGNDINTYYKVKGSELIQVVEFNEESAFPIVADPKATSKPKSVKVKSDVMVCKLNHDYWGLGITLGSAGWKITTAVKKRIIRKGCR